MLLAGYGQHGCCPCRSELPLVPSLHGSIYDAPDMALLAVNEAPKTKLEINMSIRLLLAGGTIDKHYNASNGELDFDASHIESALKLGRCTAQVTVQQVLLKDLSLIHI